jgi:tetratricopeptide (TPR) repeat protein
MTEILAAYKTTAAKLLANPDDPEQLSNQYTLLSTTKRSPAQLALAKRCYEVAPHEFIAVFNYASALMRSGRDSVEVFRQALEIAPPDRKAITLHHIGLAHHDRGEYEVALRWYELSLSADPNEPKLGQSIAIAKLAMGRLREGLYEFEVKHHIKPRKAITESGIPWWNGEDLSGKSVILTHEQGFGDTLQFIRFAPLLRGVCKRLVFSGPESLAPLIADQFDFFDDVINEEGPFEADFVTSPMAATALMGIEYKDVLGLAYMMAKPIKLPKRGKLKVGLSWKGSPGYANDALRSANLEDFCPLFDLPGAAFYSLQVRPGPTEISNLGLDGFIADLGSTLTDWRSTARAIAAMDVIVATDSANAHMAGALGKPVLLMLGRSQCWRWMSGDKTPWYQGHKIYRQSTVDCWPMAEVRDELQRMMH